MNYVDTHNHLQGWSIDSDLSVSQLLQEKKRLNLQNVTVTDHYDYDGVEGVDWCLVVDDYIPAMATLKKETGLLFGIELGYLPEHAAHLRKVAARAEWDHVILSLHFLNGLNLFDDRQEIGRNYRTHRSFVRQVMEALTRSVEDVPNANTLGHYDFCSRYTPWKESKFWYSDAPQAFDRLFQAMAERGMALELNLGTIGSLLRKGYSLEEALPDLAIVDAFHEAGGKGLTLASDAHRSGRLGRFAEPVIDSLKRKGYRELVHFEKKKAVRTRLQ